MARCPWSCCFGWCLAESVKCLTPGFQHYVAVPASVPVAVSVTVSLKTVSVPAVPYAIAGCVRCSSAAGPGGRQASFPRKKIVGGAPGAWLLTERQVRKNRTRSYINGSTATANLRKRRTIFFRKLRSFYGILTDERNSCVRLQRTAAIRERMNGYVTVETTHYC